MILIFLSCWENAHDNKEFGCENSKPYRESQIRTCEVELCGLVIFTMIHLFVQ